MIRVAMASACAAVSATISDVPGTLDDDHAAGATSAAAISHAVVGWVPLPLAGKRYLFLAGAGHDVGLVLPTFWPPSTGHVGLTAKMATASGRWGLRKRSRTEAKRIGR